MLLRFAIVIASALIATNARSQDGKFGHRQLRQMLADRPDMKGIVDRSDTVYQWVADGFQGKLLGQRIHWNANSPTSGRPAESAGSYATYPPYISITGGTDVTPIDKWAAVVFELYNLQNTKEFTKLTSAARDGTLDADEYATQCVMLEYDAQVRTRDFFQKNPLPKSDLSTDPWYELWVLSDLPSAEDFKDRHARANSSLSNFDYFKGWYTKHIRREQGERRGSAGPDSSAPDDGG